MKKSFFPFIPIVILLFLLARPQLSLAGARNGLTLWADVVLPTLLPFMICSSTIVALGGVPYLVRPFRFLLDKVFQFSEAGSFVFLSGLLCGYPMGAKTCSEFLEYGMISPEESKYLLAVSNHPSPMFLLGYVMAAWNQNGLPLLLLSVYLPLIPLSAAARKFYGCSRQSRQQSGFSSENIYAGFSFDKSMMNSFETMVKIGGYIMLFSIAAEFIRALSPFSPQTNAVLLGITEITTGIHAVASSMTGASMQLAITCVTVFGGISGIFQTNSVIIKSSVKDSSCNSKKAGLSIRHYVIWKLIHTGLSCLVFILLNLAQALPAALHP
ncbi:nucleoside recognition protein [Clostridium sp. AM58-1XD]|uniref:nucleoside recognition protein n=1 Tax=Clostridium sp. AM58-1XD TaxID=2292307 RepID=UPI000E490890|nr:nucleoside recognition protein [Clostridium sp. AM58-1XD]RGY99402.1 nucleoside recognition protein [Clostridium sp. AM58-1XD]